MDHTSEARARVSDAARVGRRTRSASRWFPRYLLLMGVLAFLVIVAVEVFFPSGAARILATTAWAAAWCLLSWWGESHDVYPEGARRRVLIAVALWLVAYLFVIGPIVRWQAGNSLGWWSVASMVIASPFLVVAWREWRRS